MDALPRLVRGVASCQAQRMAPKVMSSCMTCRQGRPRNDNWTDVSLCQLNSACRCITIHEHQTRCPNSLVSGRGRRPGKSVVLLPASMTGRRGRYTFVAASLRRHLFFIVPFGSTGSRARHRFTIKAETRSVVILIRLHLLVMTSHQIYSPEYQ